MNVFLLSSVSDATLMPDFCEVQHLKLNLSEALVARRNERNSLNAVLICEANMFFFCGYSVKKERERFAQCNVITLIYFYLIHSTLALPSISVCSPSGM